MAREERCREHAGGIEVERWARAVSMQAHINGDVQTDDGTTIGRAGSRCVGCAGVGACDMSVETGLAEGPVHYGRIV